MKPTVKANVKPSTNGGTGFLPVSAQELLLALLSLSAGRARNAVMSAATSDLLQILDLTPARLLPYLAFRLRQAGAGALPAEVHARTVEIEQLASVAYLRQQSDTRRVRQVLADNAVPALFLKGVALASIVYPQPHLRPTLDLDVWVDPTQMQSARRALEGIGLHHAAEAFGSRVDPNVLVLIQSPACIAVEIHSPPESLAHLSPTRRDRMWQRSVQTQCGTYSVSALHPEDLLLHLILHLAKSGFADGIRPFLDIALVVDHWADQWDWQRLHQEWQQDGVGIATTFTLRLVHRLLDAPVPDWLLQSARTEQFDAMEELAVRQLWYGQSARVAAGLGAAVVPMPWPQFARKMVWRSTAYYWSSSQFERRPARQVMMEAKARLLYDLRERLPLLAKAVVSGDLSPARLRWRRSLWRDRLQLLKFVGTSR